MEFSHQLTEKWKPVLDHEDLPKIEDKYRRQVTAILLENQEQAIMEEQQISSGGTGLLTEAAPSTNLGADGFTTAGAAGRKGYDPILISLIRRAAPNLIAYDIVGVQPMSGPTGLVFYLKSNYVADTANNNTQLLGNEALFDEAITGQSANADGTNVAGTGDAGAALPTGAQDPFMTEYAPASGMTTASAEALGDAAQNNFRQMSFTIDKTSVTAKSRALKAEYTTELAQDLNAYHSLDAEVELTQILSEQIALEIDREILNDLLTGAKVVRYWSRAPGKFVNKETGKELGRKDSL